MVLSRFVWVEGAGLFLADTRCCGHDVRRVWRGDRKYRGAGCAGSVGAGGVFCQHVAPED